jgi:hypothetical protein
MITCACRDLTRVRTIDAQHDEQRCENVRLLTSCLCPSWLPQVRSGAEPVSKKSTFFPRGVDHSIIRSNHHGIRGSQRKVDILLAQLITVPYHRGSVFTVRVSPVVARHGIRIYDTAPGLNRHLSPGLVLNQPTIWLETPLESDSACAGTLTSTSEGRTSRHFCWGDSSVWRHHDSGARLES